jgi:septum formation protein
MLNHLTKYRIILASNSPRRQQLLGEILPEFSIEVKSIDEYYPESLKEKDIAEYLALQKSAAFGELKNHEMVITADTIVCIGDQVLGKPQNRDEAIHMLTQLSNNTHTVFTGVTVRTHMKSLTFSDATKVTFHPISREEIEYYIDKCQPYDKAGSYGIQEWLGYVKIAKIEGEFYNVMGLPLHRLYEVLKQW